MLPIPSWFSMSKLRVFVAFCFMAKPKIGVQRNTDFVFQMICALWHLVVLEVMVFIHCIHFIHSLQMVWGVPNVHAMHSHPHGHFDPSSLW